MSASHSTITNPDLDQVATERAARIANLDAEAALWRQQAVKEVQNTRLQLLTANEHELHVEQHMQIARFELAADIEHRIFHFYGSVNEKTVMVCREHLTRWHRLDADQPVEIMLTTPGGDAWDCMALVDDMLALEDKGLGIGVTVRGTAASAGSIILQAASPGRRRMGPSSTILMHKLQVGMGGSLDKIEDYRKWYSLIQERVYDLFAERCAGSGAIDALSRDEIVDRMTRSEWSAGPQEALDLGLIDSIG